MSLRILLYSVSYPGEAGGVQAVVRRLAGRLRRQGHAVVQAWAAPNPDNASGDADYELPRLIWWRGVPTPRSVVHACRSLFKLGRDLARNRPQVVNVHFVSCESVYFFLLRPLFRYKLVLSVHGSDVLRPHPWDAAVLHRLLARADAVTAVSHLTAERVKACPGVDPARLRVIPNGVDDEFWSAAAPGPNADTCPPIVMTVGRLHPVKGHDVLLHAFARVLQRVPGAKLVIVGDGPSRADLERLTEELNLGTAVEFVGELNPEQVRSRMAESRLFVLPSRSEGLPLSLLEAMAAGLPVVATRVGGVPEVVTPGSGVLVPPEDPPALAEALSELLLNPEPAKELSRRAKEQARRFSAAEADAAYENLFFDLLGSDSPPSEDSLEPSSVSSQA